MYAIWRDENGHRIITDGVNLLDNESILAGLIESGEGRTSQLLEKLHNITNGINFCTADMPRMPDIGYCSHYYADQLTVGSSYNKDRHQYAGSVRVLLDKNPLLTIKIETPSSEEKLAYAKLGLVINNGEIVIDEEVSKKETKRLSKILETRDKKRNAKPLDKNALGQLVKWIGYSIVETLPFTNIQLSHQGKYDDGFLAIAPIATKMIEIKLLSLDQADDSWIRFTTEWEKSKANTEKANPTLTKAIQDLIDVVSKQETLEQVTARLKAKKEAEEKRQAEYEAQQAQWRADAEARRAANAA